MNYEMETKRWIDSCLSGCRPFCELDEGRDPMGEKVWEHLIKDCNDSYALGAWVTINWCLDIFFFFFFLEC